MRHGTLRDAAPGAALGSFGVLHGGMGCCGGIGESPPHSVADADNPEAVRTAAGARWIPSCARLARFRATVTNSTMSAASTTVAAAGWGEDRRGGEEGAEGETNAVTACRGRRTAGRLCARCFRAVAGAWPAGACSCWLRGELIVDQSEEPRAFSRFLCGGCIEINIRR